LDTTENPDDTFKKLLKIIIWYTYSYN
jgi:hypothetical protein